MHRKNLLYRKSILLGILLFCTEITFAQSSFNFLNLPTNAHTNALGGINISSSDANFMNNPAELDSIKNNRISLTYSPYLIGNQLINLQYINKNNWGFGIQNLRNGDFIGTDATGNLTINFTANDYALTVAHARKVNNITFGISAKLVGSFLESYSSLAILSDWGGTWKHPKKNLTLGIVAKNVGFLLKSYTIYNKPELPFDLQMGITFKPQFMPVRFSLTAHHLHEMDIVYFTSTTNYSYDNNGNKVPLTTSVGEKIARHFVLGTEILASKNINLLLGYNHLRKKELAIQNLGGLSGFSFGLRIKKLPFDFTISHARFVSSRGLTAFSLAWKI